MPGRMSEANHQFRRIKLGHRIADAQRAHEEASVRLELGEVEEATVTKAREEIATLKDRLSGLDTDWQRTQAGIAAAD